MSHYFADIDIVDFRAKPAIDTTVSYQYYQPKQTYHDKTLEELLRIGIDTDRVFDWQKISQSTNLPELASLWKEEDDPAERMRQRLQAGFEFIYKLGIKHFSQRDTDILPNMEDWFIERIALNIEQTGIKCLAFSCDLTDIHSTDKLLARAEQAFDMAHRLAAHNYVLMLNDKLSQQLVESADDESLKTLFNHILDYQKTIGFRGNIVVELANNVMAELSVEAGQQLVKYFKQYPNKALLLALNCPEIFKLSQWVLIIKPLLDAELIGLLNIDESLQDYAKPLKKMLPPWLAQVDTQIVGGIQLRAPIAAADSVQTIFKNYTDIVDQLVKPLS